MERASPPLVVVGAVTVLLVAHVIDADQALAGFSNEAVITIAALYVLAGAAEATGVLDRITSVTLGSESADVGRRSATHRELTRVLTPSAAASTLIYNTPLIGMVAPQVSAWARRSRRSPSWYLMALNAAVLLGGLVTAIGTTTNVVMSGLLTDSGRAPSTCSRSHPWASRSRSRVSRSWSWSPPASSRRARLRARTSRARAFTVEMVVTPGSALVGRTIAQAGLRNLEGVYLVELHDEARTVAPVAPDRVLRGGARLVFAGNVDRVVDLQRIPGLSAAAEPHFSVVDHDPGRQFFEVVVGPGSALAGATLKEIGFRARYEAAVVAIHRAGERVGAKLGDVVLHPGDVLLVLGAADFGARWRDRGDFLAVAPFEGVPPLRRDKAVIVGTVLAAFVVVAATGLLSVLEAALLAALSVVVLRVISPSDARRSVNLDVVVVLAASFGLGNAIAASGLASEAGQPARRRVRRARRRRRPRRCGPQHRASHAARDQQRDGGRDVPDRVGDCRGGRPRRPAVRHRRGCCGVDELPHPDRLPDQHDRVRDGRVPLLGFRPAGSAAHRSDDHDLVDHDPGRVPAALVGDLADLRDLLRRVVRVETLDLEELLARGVGLLRGAFVGRGERGLDALAP